MKAGRPPRRQSRQGGPEERPEMVEKTKAALSG